MDFEVRGPTGFRNYLIDLIECVHLCVTCKTSALEPSCASAAARLAGATRERATVLGKIRRSLNEASSELTSEGYPDEWFEDHGRPQEDLFDGRLED